MKFEDLKFVRLTEPYQFGLIPRYLFEQVKESNYIVDRLYQLGPVLLSSPLTFFYILANQNDLTKGSAKIKGFLWTEINLLDNQLKIHLFSIDKEYQNFSHKTNSQALKIALTFLREIQTKYKLDKKLEVITLRPRAYERAGWNKSKRIFMEI